MAGWAVLCWLLLITPPAAAGLLPACPNDAVRGRTRFIDPNCAWNMPQLPPNPSSLQLLGTLAGGVFPAITVGASNSSAAEQAVPGFTLTIKRLLLRNVTLAAATDTSTPTFLPLGLFSGVPEELSMMDVRLAVNHKDFQDYLAFFSKHLRAIRTKDDGGVGMHTDGSSFLNVPYWSDNHTELYSVTILTGPCNPAVGHVALSGVQTNLPGCNIRTVNNDTLVPTLQRDATINTTEPLLVRITSNVTLGPGLEGPIVVQHPVLLLGTTSAPISVDMGMMVNHLHVLAPTAQLVWQALVLENLAPGDAVSAIMAPPYSTTVTTNLWAVYCNRSQDMCVPLTNVTLVIPSQEEIDYLEFMATMYNSPTQALRSLASFYSTDLKMTKFEVAVKVMQLSAHAFSSPPTPAALQQQREGGQPQQQRVPGVYQENSRPHMAIMEAVLSTSLHHPNLVHVFTFMLRPLTTQACSGGSNSSSHQQDAFAGPAAASKRPGPVSGWELQLVMEMCEKGTLREALDYGLLPYLPPTKLLHPVIVAALAHDVAAAMLHLHSEGIVHGDLKAGNVLLQANTDVSSAAAVGFGQDVLEVWMAAGCVPLTGKVADFGLSLPIGGDTHATMAARGTPTHISPELFTSGHISKASDVYAYGILLYEVLTGHRAYAGVPIPLLPHEVAVQGLRPTWPPGMPAAYSALRALAEACWEHQPQHRPTFQAVLVTLEAIQSQQRPEAAASPTDMPACGTYRAPAAAAAAVMEGP